MSLVLKNEKYEDTVFALKKFILDFPNSVYQANANYWIGQIYYQSSNFKKAKYFFNLVFRKYPNSNKAAISMLKMANILDKTGNKKEAKKIYKKILYSYPKLEEAKQAKKKLSFL
ncbi:tol-pal system protein YbgF [bacterium endosymbiont of Pedicinus badii]|uniref:tol-pal system protein YbgF n=1 Tax=bacterium endosymbiont of Pedicinus badii TaxID=1719126 RepID=UPI0009BB6FA3|nr:tol-pal system protein YbgF [bacterium endosymbiont of Pedicinus badii]